MRILDKMRLISSVATAALAAAAPAANLVQNPDFNTDTNGWTPGSSIASFTLDGTTGSPAAPSAHAVSTQTSGVVSGCMAISAQSVDIRANIKLNSGSGPLSGEAYAYSDTTCTTYVGGVGYTIFAIVFPGSGWVNRGSTWNLPANTQSVLVNFRLEGASDAQFDHVQFGPASTTPVTLQSFDVH
jgi:hypothetical protein